MSDFDMHQHAYTYNGDGTLNTDTVTLPSGDTYIQTFSYTGGQLTGESGWVKQ
jgi:hypothetical protein